MRHRKKGRRLGRSSSHRRALLRNLASSLFLTERDAELEENAPKVKGRVVTTLQKAKEVRPLVEKCITIARKSLLAQQAAAEFGTDAERNSSAWKSWRTSDNYRKWNEAMAPAVAGRRRALQLLGDKQAVQILFEDVAPVMADRPGGYTRILRLAAPRVGDAGTRALLEFVGKNDRVTEKSEKPAFEADDESDSSDAVSDQDENSTEDAADQDSDSTGAGSTGEQAAAEKDATGDSSDGGESDEEKTE